MTRLNTHTHWADAAQALQARGDAYVIVTVLGTKGSTPRATTTKMVISKDDRFGTIGGGHLEHRASHIAAEMIGSDDQRIEYFPLGPSLGQCCGGSASLLFESFAGAKLNIALFGAGHVGRTLAPLLKQMPCRLHWFDSREDFEDAHDEYTPIHCSEDPTDAVKALPAGTWFIIMTHNHQQDYAILRAALQRGDAGYIGMIGSTTKWRRFCMRLEHEDITADAYAGVHCPIGLQQVPGKEPVEVAVSVAAQIIQRYHQHNLHSQVKGVDRRSLKALGVTLQHDVLTQDD